MCCCLWVPMCRMLAYRAEDISKRLVPHELYNREELEESVQFDVSLLCGAHITNLHSLILPLPSLSLYNPSCLNLYVSSSTSLHHPSFPSLRTSLLSPSLHLILSYHDHIFPLTHPHLLHSPLTLPTSIFMQAQVAETCILTWMKCFVKPVLVRQQQRQRRQTRVSP